MAEQHYREVERGEREREGSGKRQEESASHCPVGLDSVGLSRVVPRCSIDACNNGNVSQGRPFA